MAATPPTGEENSGSVPDKKTPEFMSLHEGVNFRIIMLGNSSFLKESNIKVKGNQRIKII
eukprot:11813760-Karenia_brevis.AAC.1